MYIKIAESCHLFSSIFLFFRQIALRICLQRPLLANMFVFSCDKVLNGEPRLARALIGGSCRPLLSCLLPMKSNSGCNNNNVDYYYEGNENDRQKSEVKSSSSEQLLFRQFSCWISLQKYLDKTVCIYSSGRLGKMILFLANI